MISNLPQSLIEDAKYLIESSTYASLLLENRIDFLKSAHPTIDTSHDTIALYDHPHEIIDYFANFGDPSRNKTYTQWILNQYKKKNIRQEDMYKVRPALELFDKHKHKLDKKDINQYKTLSELSNAVQSHRGTASTNKEETEQAIQKGHTLVHAFDDGTKVYRLEHSDDGLKASKALYGGGSHLGGTHTDWCTAARSSENMFKSYSSPNSPLYVIHTPTNHVYQAHVDSSQLTNAQDETVHGKHNFDKEYISKALSHIPHSLGLKYNHSFELNPDEINNHAINSRDVILRAAAAISKHATPETIHKALNDNEEYVLQSAALNKNLNEDHIKKLLSLPTHLGAARFLENHPNAKPEHMKMALENYTPQQIIPSLRSKHLTPDHLEHALVHPNLDLRATAIKHPNVNENQMLRAVDDKDDYVTIALAQREYLPSSVVDKLLNHPNETVREWAVFRNNLHLTKEQREKASKDPSKKVRMHVTPHLNESIEELQDVLRQYKTWGHKINHHLRNSNTKDDIVVNDYEDVPLSVNISKMNYAFDAFKEPLTKDTIFYRGLDSKFTIPPIHTEKSFTSVSKNKKTANQYAGPTGNVYKVHVPKGTYVLHLGKYATDLESEVVLPCDINFITKGDIMYVNQNHVDYNKDLSNN